MRETELDSSAIVMASDIGAGRAAGKSKGHYDFAGPDIDSIIGK
jgi:hypothetical protein